MIPERWREAEEIFGEALEAPEESRREFLRRRCRDDKEMLTAVEGLLRSDGRAGSFLDSLVEETPEPEPEISNERRVGPYRLLRKIAEGGMGSVYLAARADAEFDRQVVLKLIRQGMESAEVRQRFRVERQILASLEHPWIARLYDGGTSDENLPYLVMEYVEGIPIDEYCDREGASLDQRLALFRKVCAAVQTAHQNLVVHRDLKPSNILVTPEGEPKLLDFGIAKMLDPETATGDGAATVPWSRWLTPDYASPEQIFGRRVTTASDVYSLGVLLCKLLTGQLPRRFASRSPAELERLVAEKPVTKPSELLRRNAAAAPESVSRHQLQGDLDTIVLEALHEDPSRRYASVEQLAEDIARFQGGFPVRARRDQAFYRLRKLLRRHRLAAAVTSAFVALLVVGILTLAAKSARIAHERDQLRAVLAFVKDVFKVAAEGEELTVREAVDRSAAILDRRFKDRPEVYATLVDTTGTIYMNLWEIEPALAQLERAVEMRRRLYGDDSPELAESLSSLGLALGFQGDFENGEANAREALQRTRQRLDARHPELIRPLNNLVTLLCFKGDIPAADEPSSEALDLARELMSEDREELVTAVGNRALVLTKKGEAEDAVKLYREALDLRRRYHGEAHPDVAVMLNNLALLLKQQDRFVEAADRYRQALALQRRLFGEDDPKLALTLNNLASLQLATGDAVSAAESYGAARDLIEQTFGRDHNGFVVTSAGLAAALNARGEPQAAVSLLVADLERWRQRFGGSWLLAQAESVLGESLTALERFAEAEDYLTRSYEVIREARGADDLKTRDAQDRLVELYRAWNQPDKLARYQQPALPVGPAREK